jgi:hypothetical protein
MGTTDAERTGVLVLRAWVEGGDAGLRVRVIQSTEGAAAEPASSVSATVDDVCALVRAWLEDLVHGAPPPPGAPLAFERRCGDPPVTPE